MKVENRENFGDNPNYFIGVEVERSPLFGMNTLFVVGKQNPKEILQRMLDNGIEHVYLGCGYTFNPETPQDWQARDYIVHELIHVPLFRNHVNIKLCNNIFGPGDS